MLVRNDLTNERHKANAYFDLIQISLKIFSSFLGPIPFALCATGSGYARLHSCASLATGRWPAATIP